MPTHPGHVISGSLARPDLSPRRIAPIVGVLFALALSGCGGKWLATFDGIPPNDTHVKVHHGAAQSAAGSGAVYLPGARGVVLATSGNGGPLPADLTAGDRATIDFVGTTGRDGRLFTADDVAYPVSDYYNTGGTRKIDDEYANVGVHISPGAMVETIGGGYRPDGTRQPTNQDNVILIDVHPLDNVGNIDLPPQVFTFDVPQTSVTFDLFAQVNVLGNSLPIKLRDSAGAIVRLFNLTNANAIIDGTNFYLSGRYLVSSGTPFSSMELGLTSSGDPPGGWFLDNLNFQPNYLVRHVLFDVPGVVKITGYGTIRTVIEGLPDFDVSLINVSALRLGTPGAAPTGAATITDINGDGIPDLVVMFPQWQSGIDCGTESTILTGATTSGGAFWATAPLIAFCDTRTSGPIPPTPAPIKLPE